LILVAVIQLLNPSGLHPIWVKAYIKGIHTMMNLPITLDQITELLLNDAIRKKNANIDLIPVVKLIISDSTISVVVASIDEELKELYGLFFMPNAQPKLATMKTEDFIRLSEHLKKPILLEKSWDANATIEEYYQDALNTYQTQTMH
jgi:hypothetical protein